MNSKSFAKVIIIMISLTFTAAQISAENWYESVKLKGDLRYRHEMKKIDDNDPQHRHRIRARLGIEGQVSSEIKATMQLTTGSDDPVSTNQTLDNAFSGKSVRLDMAYFEYRPTQAPGLTIIGGKMHNPFYKPGGSELIWDGDLNPEGGAANFTHDFDNVTLTLIGAGLWIDERSKDDDSYLAAFQGLSKFAFNEKKSSLSIGGGYFAYVNAKGFPVFFDSGDPFGNSAVEISDGDDTYYEYAEDYELFEAFGEFAHEFNKVPVSVLGDYVSNTAADSLNTGWLVGFGIGKARKQGSWDFRYMYREVEMDAVVGAFTDSDFRDGGTDGKGHEFGGTYMLNDKTALGFTYFINEMGLEEDEPSDFDRMQIDLQFKF